MCVGEHQDDDQSPPAACPSWCVADHSGLDQSGQHVGASRSVVVAQRLPRTEGGFDTEIVEMAVVRAQSPAGSWLYVGDGVGQWLELSAESWQRVVGAVSEELGRPLTWHGAHRE